MTPFCCSNGGGAQVSVAEEGEVAVAVIFVGTPEGTVGQIEVNKILAHTCTHTHTLILHTSNHLLTWL